MTTVGAKKQPATVAADGPRSEIGVASAMSGSPLERWDSNICATRSLAAAALFALAVRFASIAEASLLWLIVVRRAVAIATEQPAMKTSPVLVILPIHNEAKNLEQLLKSLMVVVRQEGYDLLAIDDASTDASLEILKQYGVSTISLLENVGYGAALQTAYKYADRQGYECLIQMDGDGQHDARFLPMIRKKLACHDYVIGSRFLGVADTPFQPERDLYRGTRPRKVGIYLHRILLYIMTRVLISDPTSGYVGMSRRCVRFLSGDLFPYDFPDADVLLTLIRARFKLCEIAVYMYHNHTGGQLHQGLVPVWYLFKVPLSLLVSSLRKAGRDGDKWA